MRQIAYVDEYLHLSKVFKWLSQFKKGCEYWKTTQEKNISLLSRSMMLISFFDSKGLIHNKFLPAGQTVNGI